VTEIRVRIPDAVFHRESVNRFREFLVRGRDSREHIEPTRAEGIIQSIVTNRIGELAQRYVATMRHQVIEVLHIRQELRMRYREVMEHFTSGGASSKLPPHLEAAAFDEMFTRLSEAMDRLEPPEKFLEGVRQAEAQRPLERPWGEHPTERMEPPEPPTLPDEPPPEYPVDPEPTPQRGGSGRGGGGRGRLPTIRDQASLQRAIADLARRRPRWGERLREKTHILERAKELGFVRDVPEEWRIEVEEMQELAVEPAVSREERIERDYYNDLNRRLGPDPTRPVVNEVMHDLLLRNDAPYELPPGWRTDLQKSPEYGARVAQQAAFGMVDPVFAGRGFEIMFTAADGYVFMPDATQFHNDLTLEFYEFKDPLKEGSVEAYRSNPDLRQKLADTMIRRAESARALGPSRCRGWTYETGLPEMNRVLFDILDESLPGGSDLRQWIRIMDPDRRTL
jgi:hypothetical protein